MSLFTDTPEAPPLASSPFLTPAPFLASQPASGFGLTTSEQSLGAVVPTLMGTPTPFGPPASSTEQSSAVAQAFAALTDGAVAEDPNAWDPASAAAQSDRALARIAQVNPELAQELQAQRTGEPAQGQEDRSFFDVLKGGLSSFLDVTGLDTVLELVGRTSHVVPEIINDWGEESVWKNTSDALMGRSDVSWDDVLADKWGWDRNFFTAAVGFIGDVATDPLTYLTFGTGGVGRAITGRAVAESTVKSVLEKGAIEAGGKSLVTGTLEDAGTLVGRIAADSGAKSLDEVAAVIMNTAEPTRFAARGGETLIGKVRKALGMVHPDARAGLAYTISEPVDKAVVTELLRVADDAFKASTTVGWQRVTEEAAAKFGIDKRAVDDILRGKVRAGGLTFRNKALYEQSKAAAAALGGWRVRASIPVLGLRLSTNRLPFIPSILDFSMGRRFFAGLSGNVRLMKMVGNGSAKVEDLQAFWQKGLSGLQEFAPDVAKQLGRGHMRMGGSIFYPMSEMMGGITKNFAPSARILRGGGLAAKYAADAKRQSTHMVAQLVDGMKSVQRPDGSLYRPDQIDKIITDPLHKLGDVADLERYASLVGEDGFEAGAAAYFEEKLRVVRQATPDDEETIAALKSQQEKAVAVEARLKNAGALEAAQIWAKMGNGGFDEYARSGIHSNYAEGDPEFMDDLTPDDAAQHIANGQLPTERLRTHGPVGMGEEDVIHTSAAGQASGLHYRVDGTLGDQATATAASAAKPTAATDHAAAVLDEFAAEHGVDIGALHGNPNGPVGVGADAAATRVARAIEGVVQHPDSVENANELAMAVHGLDAYESLQDLRMTAPGGGRWQQKWEAQVEATAEVPVANAGPEYAARPLRPYKVDKRTGAVEGGRVATETVDLHAELVREGNRMFDEIGEAAGESQDLRAFREANNKAKRQASAAKGSVTKATKRLDKARKEAERVIEENTAAGDNISDEVLLARAEKNAPVQRELGQAQNALATARARELAKTQGAAKAAAELERWEAAMKEIVEGDPAREAFVGQFVTKEMQRRGYDSIITYTDDATDAIIFRSERGATPVWRMNNRAPRQTTRVNRVPRAATDEAMTAVRRAKFVQDLPGGSEAWLRQQIRDTIHLEPDVAEARIRAELEKMGVTLREGQAVLDRDPIRVINRFVDGVANDVKNHHLGRYARELEHLGFARSPWMGGQVALEKYALAGTETMGRALEKINQQARLAYERTELFQKRAVTPELRATAEAADETLATFAAEIEDVKAAAEALIDGKQTWDTNGRIGHVASNALESTDSTLNKEWASTMKWLKSKQRKAGIGHTGRYANPEFLSKVTLRDGRVVEMWRDWDPAGRRVYAMLDRAQKDTPLLGYRSVEPNGSVSAVTRTSYQGQGIAGKLHTQHWTDEGVETVEDAMALIEGQEFSKGGADLNRRGVQRIIDERMAALEKAQSDARVAFNRAAHDEREAMAEVNRVIAQETVKKAPQLAAFVPAENALNMTGMKRLQIPGFEDVAMPEFLAEEFHSAYNGLSTRDFGAAHKAFRRFNNFWKEAATWLWPGFHIRNVEGAWFNNWLGGVSFGNYVTTARVRRAAKEILTEGGERRWSSMRLVAKDKPLIDTMRRNGILDIAGVPLDEATYADFAVMTGEYGITSNNGRAFVEGRMSVEQVVKKHGQRPYERLPGPTRLAVKGLRGAGTLTENVFRTAAFVHGLEVHGNLMDARVFTMMRHGDYHDLTDFEFKTVRDLIPFYKWMRTNLPFQVHQMLEAPGKTLAAIKAGNAAWTAMGKDYDEESHKMPEWMRQTMQIPLGPGGGADGDGFSTMMLDTPMSDLHFNGREFFSSFLPLVRPLIESYVTEKSTFTGAPIEGKPIPVNPWFGGLAPLMSVVGLSEHGPDGQWYMSDKTQNILNMLPVFSRFRNWMSADPERVGQRYSSLASAMFGFSVRPVNDDTLTDTELSFYYDQILPTLDWLKGTGYQLPTTDDIAALGSTTDTVLNGLGIAPGGPDQRVEAEAA